MGEARKDWRLVSKAIKRLEEYARMWKWGKQNGLEDLTLAADAAQALKRRREARRQLELWEDGEQGWQDTRGE